MSASFNPSIVRNGLICYLDPANPASYTPGENLVTYSEQFDNVAWGKTNLTVTANAIAAPNGTLTADRFVEDATNAEHNLAYSASTATNVTRTFSVYLKAGERTIVALQLSNYLNATGQVVFNLAQGTLIYTSVNNADFTNTIGRIDDVGNGWYRCSITSTKGSVNTSCNPVIQPHNGTTTIFASNTSTGFYMWGAQLETSSSPGPYVQTVASTLTSRSTTIVNLTGNATYNGTINGSVVFNSANTTAPANFETSFSNTTYITVSGLDLSLVPHTVIGAARYSGAVRGRGFTSNNNWLMGLYNGTTESVYAYNNWIYGPAGTNDTNWRVVAASGDTTGDVWKVYVNGTIVATNQNGGRGPAGINFAWTSLYPTEASQSQMGALLAYNRILTDQEIAQTTAALRGRYGA